MTNRRTTQSNVQLLARWALPLVATTLVACGGGEEGAGSTTQSSTPVVSIGPNTSTVTTSSLGYSVFGSTSVATGAGVAATAEITSSDAEPITIAFPASGVFTAGLVIVGVNLPIAIWNGVSGNGSVPNMDWLSGASGVIPKKGNFFVFCSAGRPSTSVSDAMAQAGAQVAISEKFVAMTDVTPVIERAFNRFDCTSAAATTTILGGVSLIASDVLKAFSEDGYQPTPGFNPTYKRRAYQVTLNGQTKYVVVALDTDAVGVSTASVLYHY